LIEKAAAAERERERERERPSTTYIVPQLYIHHRISKHGDKLVEIERER
jgi:hypothetical protein